MFDLKCIGYSSNTPNTMDQFWKTRPTAPAPPAPAPATPPDRRPAKKPKRHHTPLLLPLPTSNALRTPVPPRTTLELGAKVVKSQFLWDRLQTLQDKSAVQMCTKLDSVHPLGFNCVTLSPKYRVKVVRQIMGQKASHPDSLVLVRSGTFYQAYGIDAVLCMEYAKLNPVNATGRECRVGAPVKGIQTYLNQLVSHGLEVCVCDGDEVQTIDRFNPLYFGEYMDTAHVCDVPPRIAVTVHHDCLDMYVVDDLQKDIHSYQNISLATLPLLVRLYWNTDGKYTLDVHGGAASLAFTKIPTQTLSWSCRRSEFLGQYLTHQLSTQLSQYTLRPHHDVLQRCTIEQLGITAKSNAGRVRGVHSLVEAVVPNAPRQCRQFIAKLLVCPPPLEVRELFRGLVHKYTQLQTPLPQPPGPSMSAHSLILLTRQCRASPRQLRMLLDQVAWTRQLLQYSSSLNTSDFSLCGTEIHQLALALGATPDPQLDTFDERLNHHYEQLVHTLGTTPDTICHYRHRSIGEVMYNEDRTSPVLVKNKDLWYSLQEQMAETCEDWYGAISTKALMCDTRVQLLRERYICSVLRHWTAGVVQWCPKLRVLVSKHYLEGITQQLRDHNGQELKGKWSNHYSFVDVKLNKARKDYIGACFRAQERTRQCLNELNSAMSESLLLYVERIWTVHWTLHLHTQHGLQHQWCVAVLDDQSTTPSLDIAALRPFWMPSGVPNDVCLKTMAVLTGGNMGGKSTLCRAIGGAALLAKTGFMVPATSAVVSPNLNVFLNVGSADCAENNLSGFGAECVDMIALLEMTETEQTLAISDEIFSGTSYSEGTGMTVAFLRALMQRNTVGIFSTHFDAVLAHPKLKELCKLKMEHVDNGFTYKMQPGVCTFRYATTTARQLGMPESICAEADEIRRELSGERQPKLVSRSVDEMVRDFLGKKPLFVLEKGLQCPPLASSVVYLLECPSGWYVGETDNLSQRFRTHFKSDKQPRRMLVWGMDNKSRARKVEAGLGTYLQTRGVTLLSVNDNNHTHFGGH